MPKGAKRVFDHPMAKSHYAADVFAVRCFDDRFWKTYKHFMRHLGFSDIDPESPAGGAKVFASPEFRTDREFMLRELRRSMRLHRTTYVKLFTHEDCGAYGGSSRFQSFEEEFEFHVRELGKAYKVIRSRFPALQVKLYFIDRKGVWHISNRLVATLLQKKGRRENQKTKKK